MVQLFKAYLSFPIGQLRGLSTPREILPLKPPPPPHLQKIPFWIVGLELFRVQNYAKDSTTFHEKHKQKFLNVFNP